MKTKHLHVFGIGSAIVDIQLQISHEEFHALGLDKGTMNLVDAERQRELLEKFAHLAPHKTSGGSAANTVIAVAQFGGKAGFGTLLGNDHLGQFYADEFAELGIHLVAHVIDGDTGTSVIVITPDSERTMNTALAVNSQYARHHIAEEPIKNAEWLYFESYKLTDQTGAEALEEAIVTAKKHNTRVAVSFSDTFIVNVFGEQLKKVVHEADLVFCNYTEGQAFTGKNDREEIFQALKSTVPNVALTLGSEGSLIHFEGKDYIVSASPTEPVDATGAGDMFAGGFLYGITHGHSPKHAAELGSHAAARVIAKMGPRLPHNEVHSVREIVLK
jgi:hypothetical protein